MREYRGTLDEPGRDSPYRERDRARRTSTCFARMRAGEFPDGARTLRAKIDMASPNMNLRDPVLYRILHAHHHRTGDALVHLPDVRLGARAVRRDRGHHALDLHARVREPPPAVRLVPRAPLGCPRRRGRSSSRACNLTYTVLSKRKLLRARARSGHVARLGRPAHADARRAAPARLHARGDARASASAIGVAQASTARSTSVQLENALRDDLNSARAARDGGARSAASRDRELPGRARSSGSRRSTTPRTPRAGTRKRAVRARALHRARRLPREPPKKYFRLSPGQEVRLRYAYFVTCTGFERTRDGRGRRAALHATTRPRAAATRPTGARSRAPSTGSSAAHALERRGAPVRPPLPRARTPTTCPRAATPGRNLNPDSLRVARAAQARAEPRAARRRRSASSSSATATSASTRVDSRPGAPVFNRSVTLRDYLGQDRAEGTRAEVADVSAALGDSRPARVGRARARSRRRVSARVQGPGARADALLLDRHHRHDPARRAGQEGLVELGQLRRDRSGLAHAFEPELARRARPRCAASRPAAPRRRRGAGARPAARRSSSSCLPGCVPRRRAGGARRRPGGRAG